MSGRTTVRRSSRGSSSKGYQPKRHRHLQKKNAFMGITRPAIRRLAQRGSVLRIRENVYNDMRSEMQNYLFELLGRAVAVMEGNLRKTLYPGDIREALLSLGVKMYADAFKDREEGYKAKTKTKSKSKTKSSAKKAVEEGSEEEE